MCVCIVWDCAFVHSGCVLGVAALWHFLSLLPVSLWSLLQDFFLACFFLDCPVFHLVPSLCCCAGMCPFPPHMKPSHSQFIHLSYTLLCYWFALGSQLQLLSCPLSQSWLFLGALCPWRASLEPSCGDWQIPWGAGRNRSALCAALEAESAGFRWTKHTCYSNLCSQNRENYLIWIQTTSRSNLESCLMSPYSPSLLLPLLQTLVMVCFTRAVSRRDCIPRCSNGIECNWVWFGPGPLVHINKADSIPCFLWRINCHF